jgi:hypothetical protein
MFFFSHTSVLRISIIAHKRTHTRRQTHKLHGTMSRTMQPDISVAVVECDKNGRIFDKKYLIHFIENTALEVGWILRLENRSLKLRHTTI